MRAYFSWIESMAMRRKAGRNYDLDAKLGVMERSQEVRTRSRRQGRMQRKRTLVLVLLVFAILGIGAFPSLVSHSPMGRSLLVRTLDAYDLDANVDSMQIGWLTPLQIRGLHLVGRTGGSEITVDDLQTSISLSNLWSGDPQAGQFGEVLVRGVQLSCTVDNGTTSIEQDLAKLLAPTGEPSSFIPRGTVKLQDLEIRATDAATSQTWTLSQSHANAVLDASLLDVTFDGVLSQPGGGDGSLAGHVKLAMDPGNVSADGEQLAVEIDADSLPLSVLALAQRRFPSSELPTAITGDVSGKTQLILTGSGEPNLVLRQLYVRNLVAADAQTGRKLWDNELATFDGDLQIRGGRVNARQIAAKTDFASVQMNGSFPDSVSLAGTSTNPLAWLNQVDATATVQVDLPRLRRALPELLPLRNGVTLVDGIVEARIEPIVDGRSAALGGENVRRRRLIIRSGVIQAQSDGGEVRVAPIDVLAVVASDSQRLFAEQFELESPFAAINGQGDLRSGSANVDINFGKLARILRPLIDLDDRRLEGNVQGGLQWNAQNDGLWRLRGDGRMTGLAIELTPGQSFQPSSLQSQLDVTGRWQSSGGGHLSELTSGKLNVLGNGLEADVELVQAISGLDADRLIPLRMSGQGQLNAIAQTLAPWMPTGYESLQGGFRFNARGGMSQSGAALLESMDAQITQLEVPMSDQVWEQKLVKLHFDGKASYPQQDVIIRSMTVAGDAASAAIQGEWISGMTDIEVAWQAELERLQSSVRERLATRPQDPRLSQSSSQTRSLQQVAYRNAAAGSIASSEWLLRGKMEGSVVATGDPAVLFLDSHLTGRQFELVETVPPTSVNFGSTKRVVWAEPNLRIDGRAEWNMKESSLQAKAMQIAGDWFATTLSGTVDWKGEQQSLRMEGPANFKMDEVARRLTDLTGTPIVAEGIHPTPLKLQYVQGPKDQVSFNVDGSLGWESVDAAGMWFGPAEVPFKMTESVVSIAPCTIPVLGASRYVQQQYGPIVAPLDYDPNDPATYQAANANTAANGRLLLAGDVHYRPAIWIDLKPGPIAKNVQLTPEITGQWLKYIAPIAADAARVDGTFSATLEQGMVSIDNPNQSTIRGRLEVDQVRMNAGPLADQVIAGARQLQSLAALGSRANPPRSGRTLITMPAQTIEFNVAGGVVDHRALLLEIDRAKVTTSGRVTMDGQLDLIAQIPLDASWMGSDLSALTGQTITIPVNGTLDRPRLDSSGIQRMVADMGTRAAQEAGANFLQEQIGRGQQQLEDSLNKGFEKLRIDKLFGR
ncbi:AsmA family protein [Rhodopirellula baltica]|uniref:AsmA-like C-terminal domain-containing protein n=1 Tax=Rhodopirellula baltica SWK14 TaxID=993516 RepID=L7CIJ7_RHOBT|nr:hypothetical protein [Rhodopirellula baltica]ELP33442.1 hypothetical protein RBSWK_02627 [Rhodopirellula baltica SWK14]